MKRLLNTSHFYRSFYKLLFSLCLLGGMYSVAHAQGYHIDYSTLISGPDGVGEGKTVVLNGEVYFLGSVSAANGGNLAFYSTINGYAGGGTDMVLAKIDANGNVVWSRFLGGNSDDNYYDIVVADGYVYVTGSSNSSNYPITTGAAPNFDGVFTKLYASTGAIVYSSALPFANPIVQVVGGVVYLVGLQGNDIGIRRYDAVTHNLLNTYTIGGSGNDFVGIGDPGLDTYMGNFTIANGNIYLTGVTSSSNFPVTNGSVRQGPEDLYYVVMDAATGVISFATYLGGPSSSPLGTTIHDIIVSNGCTYISGQTNDPAFPVTDGSTYSGGAGDNFVVAYDASGAVKFSKLLGSGGDEEYQVEMAVENGIVYIHGTIGTGGTNATPFSPITVGSGYSNWANAYFTKLNGTTGDVLFSTLLVQNPGDGTYAADLRVLNGEAYLTGFTRTSAFPITDGSSHTGGADFYLAKINADNSICYATVLGGSASDSGKHINLDGGNIYISGQTQSTPFPLTNTQQTAEGTAIIKYSPGPIIVPPADVASPATQTICQFGTATMLTAPVLLPDPSTVPTLYLGSTPQPQLLGKASYQWQIANSSGGPWTDIPGAIQPTFSPNVGSVSQYYQRVTTISSCEGTATSTSSVASVLVNSNTAPTVNVSTPVNTCPNVAVTLGGSPTATPNGGATITSYLWSPAGTYTPNNTVANPMVTPTSTTLYSVVVTDNNGCSSIGQQLVNVYQATASTDPFAPLGISSCQGQQLQLGVSPVGGVSGVTYAWAASPADPSMSCTNCAQPTVNPSANTTYTITLTVPVTGGATCTTTDMVTVTPVPAPTAGFAGPDRTICIGNTASIGTPANPNYTYTWAPGNYLTDNHTTPTTFQPGSLALPIPDPITYYLTAWRGGCSFVDQMEASVIEARAGVDGCGPRYVGEPDRTPNINETYAWTKISGPGNFAAGAPTNEPLAAVTASVGGSTIYRLTVTHNGTTCTDDVVVPPCGCVVDIDVSAPYKCPSFGLNGGNVTLIATAADIFSTDPAVFSYSWSPNVGLSAYTGREVMLTDNVDRTYTVTMSSPFDPTFMCTRTIRVNNPAWSLPVFTAQDVSTCPSIPVAIGQNFVAGYTYQWTDPNGYLSSTTASNPIATVNGTADFAVTVTDVGSGCIVTDVATVTVAGIPSNVAGADVTICGPGTVQLGLPPIAGLTYSWAPAAAYMPNGTTANPTIAVAATTTYTLTATHPASGCFLVDNVTVRVNSPAPMFSFSNQTFCPSTAGAMPLPAGPAGMSAYEWSPAAIVQNFEQNGPTATTTNPRPQSATTYTLTVTNSSGCKSTASVTFTPTIAVPIAGVSRVICRNSPTQLGGTNLGGTYVWSPATGLSSTSVSNPIFSPPSAGEFTFTVSRTEAGCTATATVTVVVNDFFLFGVSPSTTVCQNACTQIGITPQVGVTYLWSPTTGLSDAGIGNPIACVGNTSTTYTLTGVGTNGCTDVETITVGVNPANAPTITLNDVSACIVDASVTLTPTVSPAGTYSYAWQPTSGALSNAYIANPVAYLMALGTSTYTVTVTNTANGCTSVADVDIAVSLCANDPICPTITNPSATQTICTGNAGASLSVSTTATGTDIIKFVRFGSQQTDPATIYGGTSIGTATPAGGTATLAYNWSGVSPGMYYVYAILNPSPDPACLPYQEIVVTVTALPTISVGTPTCNVANTQYDVTITTANATTLISSAGTVSGSAPTFTVSGVPSGTTITLTATNTGVTPNCVTTQSFSHSCAPACPTISNPSAAQALCSGSAGSSLSVSTSATGANAINFVRFTSQQTVAATIYGGTSMGMATPAGGTATLAYNWSAVAPGVYYVYAILNPDPGSSCRPYVEIVVTVTAPPALTVTNGTICSGGSINLATLVTSAGGGSLSYYATAADANAGTNPLASSTVSPASATNYYIRSQTSSTCYSVGKVAVMLRAPACATIQVNGPN